MNNSVNLYSISELLEKKFFVPSYQRGYRWTEQQVKELLDDIFSFATKKKADGEFYCLQPIVVKKRLDDDKSYELIDGQQRLTTLKILLEYLEKVHLGNGTLKQEYGKDIFSIKYETREKTSDFLKNISQNTSEENIDFYLISEAYKTIDAWFKSHEKPKFVRESIIRTLVFGNDGPCPEGVVKVIWYELESDPIESFKRINTGKIPLTNAELIRALLLQFKNFENEDSGSRIQLEMATEWDNIEHALQDENFWWFLNKSQNDTPARIQFIFDYMYRLSRKTDEAKALERYGNDKYSTFRYFNELIKISKANEIWADVKKFFSAFSDWYENSKWYHYIGYLIFCGEDIEDIYNIYKNQPKTNLQNRLLEK